ncbi:MAG: hypothetical protein ABI091_20935, partial [Ferruginibacter sp.]
MKKLLVLSMLFCALQITAQTSPPRIKIPGSEQALPQGSFKTNTTFIKGQRYYSADNRYCLIFQEDGNLVIYKFATASKYSPIWSSKTTGIAMKSCIFQQDGNLVMYDYAGKPRWGANGGYVDNGGSSGDKFYPTGPDSHWITIQNDGNL